MVKKNIAKSVQDWAKEIGERAAQARLIGAGASPNTAQKLTSGRYPHKPGSLLESAIRIAMAKDEADAESA